MMLPVAAKQRLGCKDEVNRGRISKKVRQKKVVAVIVISMRERKEMKLHFILLIDQRRGTMLCWAAYLSHTCVLYPLPL